MSLILLPVVTFQPMETIILPASAAIESFQQYSELYAYESIIIVLRVKRHDLCAFVDPQLYLSVSSLLVGKFLCFLFVLHLWEDVWRNLFFFSTACVRLNVFAPCKLNYGLLKEEPE